MPHVLRRKRLIWKSFIVKALTSTDCLKVFCVHWWRSVLAIEVWVTGKQALWWLEGSGKFLVCSPPDCLFECCVSRDPLEILVEGEWVWGLPQFEWMASIFGRGGTSFYGKGILQCEVAGIWVHIPLDVSRMTYPSNALCAWLLESGWQLAGGIEAIRPVKGQLA